jgi:hypothetical protein
MLLLVRAKGLNGTVAADTISEGKTGTDSANVLLSGLSQSFSGTVAPKGKAGTDAGNVAISGLSQSFSGTDAGHGEFTSGLPQSVSHFFSERKYALLLDQSGKQNVSDLAFPDPGALVMPFTLSPYGVESLLPASLAEELEEAAEALRSEGETAAEGETAELILALQEDLEGEVEGEAVPMEPADFDTLAREYVQERIVELAIESDHLEAVTDHVEPEPVPEDTGNVLVEEYTALTEEEPVSLTPGVRVTAIVPRLSPVSSPVKSTRGFASLKSEFEGEGEVEGETEGEEDAFADLDLRSDLTAFLSFLFEDYETGQETTFDFNGFTVIEEYGEDTVTPAANGIPDLAELLVLESFLKNPLLNFSASGGPSHTSAVARWQYFETLHGPVSDPALQPVYNIGLAYCCLGDFMSIYLGMALASMATGEELDGYDVVAALESTSYAFSQCGDIDGDGYSALIEWQEYGVGQTFDAAYGSYEDAALSDAEYPEEIEVHTVTRSTNEDIILFYPPEEIIAEGTVITQYALFAHDPADFDHTPFFDHWKITGESPVSPRYSGKDSLVLTVTGDITIDMAVIAPDPDTVVTFEDEALKDAVRFTIGKPTGNILLGDVCNPDVTTLYYTGNQGIVSLDGLEQCRYLNTLDLSQNSISDLAPLETLYRLEDAESRD